MTQEKKQEIFNLLSELECTIYYSTEYESKEYKDIPSRVKDLLIDWHKLTGCTN